MLTTKMSESPPKTRRYYCFEDEWLTDVSFSQWLRKEDDTTAYCKMCKTTFTIKHKGETAIKLHQKTKKHVQKCQLPSQSQLSLTKFFTRTPILPDPALPSVEEDSVAVAELILAYHGVKHHHGYVSQDCGNKLLPRIFSDSKIAPKIQCGRRPFVFRFQPNMSR